MAIELILVAAGAMLLVPALVLFFEILFAANSPRQSLDFVERAQARAAILVPAHNEEVGIARTVANVVPQLADGDYILVVADNCSDNTAAVARRCGAQAIERNHQTERGKGYALAFGLDEIRKRGCDVVIFIDADCVFSDHAVAQLKAAALLHKRPVQCLDIMSAPAGMEMRYAVASFAWRIKNQLRPLGLSRFGLPCQLMGTGMAMPLPVANRVHFASGNVVEDLELGINLAGQGYAPLFFPSATVTSSFPTSEAGEIAQRRRWEGGSMAMLFKRGYRTVLGAIATGNIAKMTMGLDMLVPPLVMQAAMLVGYGLISAFCALLFAVYLPLKLALVMLVVFAAAIGMAWIKAGRDVLPVRSWIALAPFILRKLRIHKRLPATHEGWVRADRSDGAKD